MKKAIVLVIIVLMVTGVAWAEIDEVLAYTERKGEKTAAVLKRSLVSLESKSSAKKETVTQLPTATSEEVLAKKKSDLNGTKWGIELKSVVTDTGKSKVITETDVVSFSEGKVMSEKLAALGYAATGFGSRLEEDGTLIWETMQISEEDGQAFWRGDIGPDGIMRGVLSRRDLEEKVAEYNFVGTANK